MLHTAQMRSDKVLGLVGVAADPDFTETLVWPALDEATKEKVMAEGIAGKSVRLCVCMCVYVCVCACVCVCVTLAWLALDEATKEKVMAEGIAGEFVYAGGGGRACGYLWMGGEWV